MKRLSHKHLVQIVGSYTDSQCFAYLMEPIADVNMLEYLQTTTSRQAPTLRKFYGCLSNAVTYLHHQKVYHMDIKLENILVKQDEVFVGDFGAAHDFSRKERSTTWSTGPRTSRYMPPEIARDPHSPRNYATDIWSLGVVFLEMTAVLRGQALKSFRSYLIAHGTKHQFVYGNQAATHSYFELLRTKGTGPESDNEPLLWVKDMIHPDSVNRPTARDIRNQILQSNSADQFNGFCCAGKDQLWETSATSFREIQRDSDEIIDIDDDSFTANEHLDNVYAFIDPSKTHAIESWISQGSVPVHAELETDISTENGEMPFDIEDDEASNLPSIAKCPALNRIPDRLASFDFHSSFSDTNHLPKSEVHKNTDDELPFDLDVDDADSLESDTTVRPVIDALGVHAENFLQALDDLDRVPLSSGFSDSVSPAISSDIATAASQASEVFHLPQQPPLKVPADTTMPYTIDSNLRAGSTEIFSAASQASEHEGDDYSLNAASETSETFKPPPKLPPKIPIAITGAQIAGFDPHTISAEIPPAASHTSDEMKSSLSASSKLVANKSTSKIINSISHAISAEVFTAANQITENSTSYRRFIAEGPAKKSTKKVTTGTPHGHSSTSSSQDSPLRPASKLPMKQSTDKSPADKANALTRQNILKLELSGKFAPPSPPLPPRSETYKAYMQHVWEAKSSQATTEMSEGTRSRLQGSGKFIAWQDYSLDLLHHYVLEGKVQAVRQLLQCGCNPGTKVSEQG